MGFDINYANSLSSEEQLAYAIEYVARAAHETNRAYCRALGDHSQLHMEHTPEWQKDSARKGVMFILANPDAPPSASHESWLAEKTKDGWKYGPVKDVDKKEHPCYVPYDELPGEQKAKDHLFGVAVRLNFEMALD